MATQGCLTVATCVSSLAYLQSLGLQGRRIPAVDVGLQMHLPTPEIPSDTALSSRAAAGSSLAKQGSLVQTH